MTDTEMHDNAALTIEQVEAQVQHRQARHQMRARTSAVVYPIVTVIGTLLVWEIVARVFRIPSFLLPLPA